jgi:hypothetical protein
MSAVAADVRFRRSHPVLVADLSGIRADLGEGHEPVQAPGPVIESITDSFSCSRFTNSRRRVIRSSVSFPGERCSGRRGCRGT